jgi:hypothetical protein
MHMRILLVVALLGVITGVALKLRPPPDVRTEHGELAEAVLGAMERKDYAAFVAQADKRLRNLRREEFELLAAHNAPRLQGGHSLVFLDDGERSGVHQSRWRVTFANGTAETVLTLGVRDGRVASFSMR